MINYKFMTLAEVTPLIDYSLPLMTDTETVGFYGRIRLLQLYQRHFECPVLVEWPNPMEIVAMLTKAIVVCHNVHYDISTIQYGLGHFKWAPNEYHCTQMLSRLHFFNKLKADLESVITYIHGDSPYGMEKKDMQKSDWDVPVLSEDQKVYAALDVLCLHDIWDVVEHVREDINYKLDMLCIKYCLDFQNNGMPLDLDIANKHYADNMARIDELGLTINCNSFKQVREYIGSDMSDDHGLAVNIAQGNERAAVVRETRGLVKQNSDIAKWIRESREGVLYGLFKPSARSGRTTSNDVNLQQINRLLKDCFGVPEGGDEVILHADFAQIQLRAVCVVAPDRVLERLFRAGQDLHGYVADMLFGSNYTKEQRQIAKTSNFSLLFGAGITVFKAQLLDDAGLFLEDEEASKIKNKWLNLFLGIKTWQKKGIKDWKNGVAWETPLGRKYTSKMMTDQLAMQIQGFEAEVAKLAMHYMLPKLAYLDPNILLRDFIHDGYIFTCPNEAGTYQAACKIIAESMQEAWQQMSQSVIIKDLAMPTSVSVGWNWGKIEKFDPDKHGEAGEGKDVFYQYSI